jgi:ParB family transcriptional regulator, chromosome partitioning protein
MNLTEDAEIHMILISGIEVINPRARNQKEFKKIVNNISRVGLKKPITVSLKPDTDPPQYYLACGQGRMEAFLALKQTEIPAVVLNVSREECMVISLVENLARRKQKPLELFSSVKALKKRGYTYEQIGEKIDMSPSHISGILTLFNKGEEGLIRAVMLDKIPVSVAIGIAGVEEKDAQIALQEAYESEEIRGKDMIKARRIVERRLLYGKKMVGGSKRKKPGEKITGKTVALTIQQEADRKQSLIRKADRYRNNILFIASATKKLRDDPNYMNLLHAVGFNDMPELLETRIMLLGKAHG